MVIMVFSAGLVRDSAEFLRDSAGLCGVAPQLIHRTKYLIPVALSASYFDALIE